jgi:hypothetical protein
MECPDAKAMPVIKLRYYSEAAPLKNKKKHDS